MGMCFSLLLHVNPAVAGLNHVLGPDVLMGGLFALL